VNHAAPKRPSTISRAPILPDRVRHIDGQGFAFIPFRFLRDGFLAALTRDQLALYLLLVLAGDRNGVSFYHYDSLCSLLGMTLETYLEARGALIDKDLLAFDGTRFQVLSLPERPIAGRLAPLNTQADLAQHDPATVRSLILASLDDAADRKPPPRR
jgi:hypothetical protein